MRRTLGINISEWTGIRRPAVDFWLQRIVPTASLDACRARVRRVEEECPGIKTVTLRPNRHWSGFTPGQHVHVTLEVDGVRLRRTWTISSSAEDRDITLTIGRIPGGRATQWIHDRLQVGDVVELSQAQGSFTLPEDGSPVVFLAGGAGVTPALSMLRSMRARRDMRRFELVHFVRGPAYAFARHEFEAIQDDLPNVRTHVIETYDDDPTRTRRISKSLLQELRLGRDPAPTQWMICGPSGFMDAAHDILADLHPDVSPRSERFTPPSMDHAGQGGTIHLRDGTQAPNSSEQTLLTAIEAAGKNPKHGCRAGICFECTCVKKEGVVLDLRTGKLLDEDGEAIQLCVSQAVGDVTLDV